MFEKLVRKASTSFSLLLAIPVPVHGWLSMHTAFFVPFRCADHATRIVKTTLFMSNNSEHRASSRRIRMDIPLGPDGKVATVISRDVQISPHFSVRVWELEKMANIVEEYWTGEQENRQELDPFGLVSWPGSVVAAQELIKNQHIVHGARVLVLGAGCGIEAQAAARLGAASVLATDIHPTTLKLLELGAKNAVDDTRHIISTALFDITSTEALPQCELMIMADVLYNAKLKTEVVRRCVEARSSLRPPPIVLVTDSQRFLKSFERDLNSQLESIGHSKTAWSSRHLSAFTGSGVAIDEDQTYDVDVGVLWIGLEDSP